MGGGLTLTVSQAAWFLAGALPISLYVGWSDMKRLKIPNVAVMALVLAFAVLGLIALPLPEYLWRWTHLAVVLVIGIAMNSMGLLGAGDAKFAAAAAPFFALADLGPVLYLMAACFLAAFIAHRIAKYTPIRRLAPDWESWTSGKRFPMGMALGLTLVAYLALGLWQGTPAT
jgi:prepilin peptidase CpaA